MKEDKIDKLEFTEKESSLREKLLSLEEEGKFVFHGSSDVIKKLEPRQPYISNKETKKQEKHGEPCVAATSHADIAIFRAIVNNKNFSKITHASRFWINKNNLPQFATTKKVLENVKDKKGFVYVLDKSLFNQFSGMEWRINKDIEPIEVISVTNKDLPPNIQLIDKDFKPIKT